MGHEPDGTASVRDMYNGIEKINQVLEYIEENVTENISCSELARIAALSDYEFRRVFSFITGVPVAEYIRRRRLSLAAEEIKAGNGGISEIGAKYGYDSPSSFSRAFKEMFSVSPLDAKDQSVKLNVFLKPRFELYIRGGTAIEYTEIMTDSFYISGVSGESLLTDTCCCESIWQLYEQEVDACGKVYAAYLNGDKNVICHIGEKCDEAIEGKSNLYVPAGKWICFDVAADADERQINDLYEKISFSFLPSGIYKRDQSRANLEVFEENGDFTIMIPIISK